MIFTSKIEIEKQFKKFDKSLDPLADLQIDKTPNYKEGIFFVASKTYKECFC